MVLLIGNLEIFSSMLIAIIGLIIIAIPFVVALFINKEYSAESEIVIDRPNPVVFDYLRYLKNHETFSRWGKTNAPIIKQYFGTDGTVGFISSWESPDKKVGKGQQEIRKITIGKRIDLELRILKPYPSVAQAYLTTDPVARNQTIVVWGFSSSMSYPMNLLLLFNIKKMIQKDLSQGLISLKQELEKEEYAGYKRRS
jgi:hypothetical protein